ncbi:carboxypeptidase inhibitor SmCI-like [Podarcis lilfordi]|nr:carboxypeptidase inhibitor SmCI-like [Podarcis lilfordi]
MPRKCTLTPKYGKCSSSLPHFYYDAKSNMCRKFIYSGCGGNGNNFQYYYQCVLKCQQFDPPPKCKQPLILGDCKASKRRYYYDAERKRCFVFIYSGCGSNGNNFDSFRECYEECEKYETPEHLINPDKLEDFLRDYCDQPLDVGCCNKDLPRFYYDYSSRTCKPFNYGGCAGNRNNFETENECLWACAADASDI